jgi:hypothetical protein
MIIDVKALARIKISVISVIVAAASVHNDADVAL